MRIIYLDQNKWIDLAHAAVSQKSRTDMNLLLKRLMRGAKSGKIALPLTATNIYETYKINDPNRRRHLAQLQSELSCGWVFRGRHRRLETEISNLLHEMTSTPKEEAPDLWFLSKVFFESTLESDDPRAGLANLQLAKAMIEQDPVYFMYNFLANSDDVTRVASVKNFSRGSEELRKRIEQRRTSNFALSMSERRKTYSALLMANEIDLIMHLLRKAGASWETVRDIPPTMARRIVRDTPTYFIEREIALRLEAQAHPINENDIRDMQSYCAAVPYANEIVSELHFTNLARQCGLDKKFGTTLTSDIMSLMDNLS